VLLQVPADHAVRADHYAGPASDAFIIVGHYNPIIIPAYGTADTGMHAGCIFAVATYNRYFPVRGYPFHIDASFGHRFFRNGTI
jgi:hypothetical protein